MGTEQVVRDLHDGSGSRPKSALVGILGGMGPAATADFYDKLIRSTPARVDQDHLPVVIWADPSVPDRSAALLEGGADPTPFIARGVQSLRATGATLIVITCNTAHAFLPDLEGQFGVRIIHMIEETVRHVGAMRPSPDRVALLATTGTVRAGLYQDWLRRAGKAVVLPDASQQKRVMQVIREVKAGQLDTEVRARIATIAEELVQGGAEVVVAGCTEIPLVLEPGAVPVPVVDPAQVLADAVVAATRGADGLTDRPAGRSDNPPAVPSPGPRSSTSDRE